MQCRTAALGVRLQAWPDGHVARVWSNSCRQRSCPQGASLQTARGLAVHRARLLACAQAHGLFTLPPDLTSLWLANVAGLTTLLLQARRDPLGTRLADPPSLGAPPGSLAALHPWSPPLVLPPHVHCLVTGGGLTSDGPWQAVRTGLLVPVRVGMAGWRGTWRAAIRQALAGEALVVPEDGRPPPRLNLLTRLGHPRKPPWHVHIRERSRPAPARAW
jgi:hypothetical protein